MTIDRGGFMGRLSCGHFHYPWGCPDLLGGRLARQEDRGSVLLFILVFIIGPMFLGISECQRAYRREAAEEALRYQKAHYIESVKPPVAPQAQR
jgi:hypothetical protein